MLVEEVFVVAFKNLSKLKRAGRRPFASPVWTSEVLPFDQ